MTIRSNSGLFLAVSVSSIGYMGMVWLDVTTGTLRDEFTPQTIGWYLVAFVGFGIAVWWNQNHPIPYLWLWLVPVAFRLVLLVTTPTLSDDVYRYVWDGHVTTSGINPYAYALDAVELDAISIPARELANNPGLSTPYLPVSTADVCSHVGACPVVAARDADRHGGVRHRGSMDDRVVAPHRR